MPISSRFSPRFSPEFDMDTRNPALGGIRLVLGGNVFGWTADQDTSFSILDTFFEAGGRMVDTADMYSAWVPGHKGGESETVLGAWMKARGNRKEMRIATKLNGANQPGGLAPEKIAASLEASLKRLQTDYVDLYYAHRDDTQTPLDVIAGGFDAQVRAGKVRAVGASNFTSERLQAARQAALAGGFAPYTVIQNEYNLLVRGQHEGAMCDICTTQGVAALPYYGLAAGFLTGKYRTEADLAKSPRGQGAPKRHLAESLAMLERMDKVAAQTGATLAQIALAWVLARPGIAAPISSATSVAQVKELIGATSLSLSPEHLALLG
jgi:aryl-alcohol dehydrogenase-like predicted oxidoreductase